MLEPNLEDMRKEIDAFPVRLQALKEKLQEGHRFSDSKKRSLSNESNNTTDGSH
jgi:hypothetical protein